MTNTYTWLVEYMSCYPQAEGESELDGLVEHHLAYLANPNPVAPVVQPSSVKSLEEQQTLIDTLMARPAALEAK